MLAALSGLVSLFDFIELLRRSATKPDATFGLVLQIAALRLPYIAMQILPFAVLLGGIIAFWRLTRSSELIVARAAGVSAWQFLAAPRGLRAAAGQLRDRRGQPALLADAGPGGVAGQHLPAHHRRAARACRAGSSGCGRPTVASTRPGSPSCTRESVTLKDGELRATASACSA